LISRWLFKLRLRTAALPRNQVAILLGAVTPFLPCGPLYLMLGVALVSGAALTGAQVMASFALGTIPLFALAQVSALHWQGSLAPRAQQWTRRGLALGAALLIGGRAVLHSDSLLAPVKCLLCH
jgi:sulfite exporter TauE/SafE